MKNFRVILAFLSLPLLAWAQEQPPAVGPKCPLEDIRGQVGKKMEEAAEVKLDLATVKTAGSPQQKRTAALATLRGMLENGPDALAMHVLTFLSYAPAPELEAAVSARLGRLPQTDTEWMGKHLRLSAQNYLAQLGDTASQKALLDRIEDPDAGVRVRIYRLVREGAGKSWVTPAVVARLQEKAQNEKEPAARVAAVAACAAIASSPAEKAAAKETMEALAQTGGTRQRARGKLELSLQEAKALKRSGAGQPAGGSAELLALAKNGRHDERMFALEALAQKPSPQAVQEITSWAESENWRDRLRSAFYLVLTKNSAEAARRLQGETNSMVQTALLSALAQKTEGTKP